jgi:hypothetical protein
MSDLEVAESVLAIPMAYNSQQTNSSKYEKRQVQYLYPTQNTPLDSGASSSLIYRFLVPSDMFLDTKESYISTEAFIYNGAGLNNQVPISSGDRCYFTPFTDCWIQRLTILTATGIKIEEIIDANILAAIMRREMEPTYANSVGTECMAMWSSQEIGNSALNTGKLSLDTLEKQFYSTNPTANKSNPNRFVIPLNFSGFLKGQINYLPLRAMSQGQSNSFQIEIEFGRPASTIIAYNTALGTAPTGNYNYVIQSCYYVMNLIKNDEKEAEIMEIIKTTPLILSYQTHNHFSNTVNASGGVSQTTMSVTEYQESVSEIKFAFRNQARVNNISVDTTQFANPNLIQSQLQLGNLYIPSQPTPVGKADNTGAIYVVENAEQFMNNTITNQKCGKFWRGFQARTTVASGSGYVSSYDYPDFVVYYNLRTYEDDAVGDPLYNQYTSGVNLRSNPVPLQFIFTSNFGLTNLGTAAYEVGSTAPTSYLIDSYTTFRSNLVIQRGENYVIS